MGELMRSTNWKATSIGSIETWPQSLRTSVSTCLNSRFPILLWWGPDLVMLYNDAYRPILGNKHPASLGSPGREVWPEIWHIIGPMLEAVLKDGTATWSENQLLILERNGYPEECYFTFSYSPIHDESGGIGGVFCAVTETTEAVIEGRRLQMLRHLGSQLKAREDIQEIFLNTKSVLESNPQDFPFALLYQTDPALGSTHLTVAVGMSGFEEVVPVKLETVELQETAWPLADVITSNQPVLLHSAQLPFDRLPTGPWQVPPQQVYLVPIAPSRTTRPYCVLIVGVNPHLSFDDRYRSFFQLIADQIATEINNVMAHEEERKRTQALLELNQAKTNFFSNVSHEFRTPLTLLLGPLDELLRESNLTERQQEQARAMQRNALRLLKLVNTLLDFSRLEAKRLQPHFEQVNLGELTIDLTSNFRSAAEKAGLQLVIQVDPFSRPVDVDREMWEKIVLNLLSNAFKFTLTGEIRIELKETGQEVIMKVSDTGIGIPPDQLALIFDRFYQANNPISAPRGRTFEGTGIGLALVKELIELQGGSIEAESEPGKGSAFTVHLPRQLSGKEGPNARKNRLEKNHTLAQFMAETEMLADTPTVKQADDEPTKPRLVLVEDNSDMREYLSRLMAPYFRVETAEDGLSALEIIRQRLPELVLSDVMMPGIDGFALLKALKNDARTAHIPFIMLSARAGEEATLEGYNAGADDYVVKPFTANVLLKPTGTCIG